MTATRQLPGPGELFLDHSGHFVPDMDSAAAALERLGFTLTPYAVHAMTTEADATPRPSGTANRCVMLRAGYLEILSQVNDEPLGRQLRAALDRHTGLHLIAFATDDAQGVRDRLVGAGFRTQPVVNLSRTVAGPDDTPADLAFTVVRLEPGQMPEGRIQCLRHDTPDILWQERYMTHANGAQDLRDILIAEADVTEASQRFARYLGRAPEHVAGSAVFRLDRGTLTLAGADAVVRALGDAPVPNLPFIAAQSIAVDDIARTRRHLRATGVATAEAGPGAILVGPDPALGSTMLFLAANASPPWLRYPGRGA